MDTNRKPLVSVNIITHNRANYLPETLDSVLAQDYTNWELIILDDASNDNTQEVVAQYLSDDRIKYIRDDKHSTISVARNKALSMSQGEYIAILDSDDLWSDSEKLAKQIDFLEKNTDYLLIGTGVILIDGNSQEIKRYLNPKEDRQIRKGILAKNPFAHSSVVYRKKEALELGVYNDDFNVNEDYDLWLRMGTAGKLANLSEYGLKYRVHGNNVSITHRLKLMRLNINLVKKFKDNYPKFYSAILRRYLRLIAYQILSWIKS